MPLLHAADLGMATVVVSSRKCDLHAKKAAYEKAGEREYLVVALRMDRVFWFVRRRGKFKTIAAGSDEIVHSESFLASGSTRRPCSGTIASACWQCRDAAWHPRNR